MSLSERQETQADRNRKMIILSERDVEDATRLLRLLAGDDESSDVNGSPSPDAVDINRERLLIKARQVLRDRQIRCEYFNRAIFSEAAWDILLVLYVTDSAGARQTQATLSKRLATPPTTIQRWLDYLEKERLVRRDSHPNDRRVSFVMLQDKGRRALDDYLSAIGA